MKKSKQTPGEVRMFKLTNTSTHPMETWKTMGICEKCLDKRPHLKRDWFVKIEEASSIKCEAQGHKKSKENK